MIQFVHKQCQIAYKRIQNSITVLEIDDRTGEEVALRQADLWECPCCGHHIVTGLAQRPWVTSEESDFRQKLEGLNDEDVYEVRTPVPGRSNESMPRDICCPDCLTLYHRSGAPAHIIEMFGRPPRPYKLYSARLAKCGCGEEIVVDPYQMAEHYQDGFGAAANFILSDPLLSGYVCYAYERVTDAREAMGVSL